MSERMFHPVRLGEIADFPPEPRGSRPWVTAFVADPTSAAATAELAYVHNTGGTSADWLDPHAMFVIWCNTPLDRFRWEIRGGREVWLTHRFSLAIDWHRVAADAPRPAVTTA
jgi:hypothetical protein